MIYSTISNNIQYDQLLWDKTPNFRNGLFAIQANLEHIAGEKVYGKGRSRKTQALKSVTSFLQSSTTMDMFKSVEGGTIIKTPPTKDEFITKLKEFGIRAVEYFSSLPYDQTEVTDHWAIAAKVREGSPLDVSVPLQKRILDRSGKRFSAKTLSVQESVVGMIKRSRGMLAEGNVIAFLNSGLRCPECKQVGYIGWCNGISHRSVDSFRDAICMKCHNNGVVTLFEIKTRWENDVLKCGNSTYAGSFVALNTLMTLNANVYLVLASRDTGKVRIGKITSAKMRGNHNWLYALQEDFTWGSPSSFVTCANGFFKCPVEMPKIIETLTDKYMDEIINDVLMLLF